MYTRIKIPFISNLKKSACASKRDVLSRTHSFMTTFIHQCAPQVRSCYCTHITYLYRIRFDGKSLETTLYLIHATLFCTLFSPSCYFGFLACFFFAPAAPYFFSLILCWMTAQLPFGLSILFRSVPAPPFQQIRTKLTDQAVPKYTAILYALL